MRELSCEVMKMSFKLVFACFNDGHWLCVVRLVLWRVPCMVRFICCSSAWASSCVGVGVQANKQSFDDLGDYTCNLFAFFFPYSPIPGVTAWLTFHSIVSLLYCATALCSAALLPCLHVAVLRDDQPKIQREAAGDSCRWVRR